MDPEPKEPDPSAEAVASGGKGGGGSWISRLIRAGLAVADGTDTDWAAIDRFAHRPRQRAQLRELQQIEEIARHCRAAQTGVGPTTKDAGSTPGDAGPTPEDPGEEVPS